MSLFEFFGEHNNPGNIGRIENNIGSQKETSFGMLISKTIISVGIIVGLYILIFGFAFQFKGIMIYLGVMLIYCLISYFVIPKPDYSNIGLLGGLVDHPFRFSDDINRSLIFFMIILYPGRLISTTIVTWIKLCK